MKKEEYNALSYPQKGALGIFNHRYTSHRMDVPVKIIGYATAVCPILFLLLWIFLFQFWMSALITFTFFTTAIAFYWLIASFVLRSCNALYRKKVKDSELWQQSYLRATIADYERAKRDYPKIIENLQPISLPDNLNFFEEFAAMPVKTINARSAFYKVMAESNLKFFESNYRKTMQYLSETNQTLPLI